MKGDRFKYLSSFNHSILENMKTKLAELRLNNSFGQNESKSRVFEKLLNQRLLSTQQSIIVSNLAL